MKTLIEYQYEQVNENFIQDARILDEDNIMIITKKYKEPCSKLHLTGKVNKIVEIDNALGRIQLSNFGYIAISKNKLNIYDVKSESNRSYNLSNYPRNIGDRNFSHVVYCIEKSASEIIVGVQSPGTGDSYYARYLDAIELRSANSIFKILGSKDEAKFRKNFTQLDKTMFSPIYFDYGKYNEGSDWLSIRDMSYKDGNLYVYTNGGGTSRGKTTMPFEISEIGILNDNLQVKEVFVIEKGRGRFSSNKKYFVQTEFKNTKNVHVYELDEKMKKITLRLTPKKNLGLVKNQFTCDISETKLLSYNFKHLTLSKRESYP